MRYEFRKLFFRREVLVLALVFLGALVFLCVRVDFREHDSVWDSVCYQEFASFQETELLNLVQQFKDESEHGATAYIRADYRKAFDCYNVQFSFHPFDTINARHVLSLVEYLPMRILLILLVLGFLCPLFTQETEFRVTPLLLTTRGSSRRLFYRKMLTAFLSVLVICFLYTMISSLFLWMYAQIPLSALAAPVRSLVTFHHCPFRFSIGCYLLLLSFCRALAALPAVAIIFLLSALPLHRLTVLGITSAVSGVFFAVSAVSEYAHWTCRQLGLLELLSLEQYCTTYETVNVLGVPVFRITLAILFTVLFAATIIAYAAALALRPERSAPLETRVPSSQ